jgi:RNA 2',3'-cyclic 3'-phosphodiesterase
VTSLRRAFLAAVPPAPVLDAVEGLVAGASRRGFRWTRRDQWHITIQYFGKVADADALVGALAGAVARVPAPTVLLRGAGGFPSVKRAAVYWLGVEDPAGLAAVHAAVIDAAGSFVRSRDVVHFTPHLTLARLPSPKKLTEEVDALGPISFGPSWTVDEVVLMESETRRDGAVYHEVARLPLGE